MSKAVDAAFAKESRVGNAVVKFLGLTVEEALALHYKVLDQEIDWDTGAIGSPPSKQHIVLEIIADENANGSDVIAMILSLYVWAYDGVVECNNDTANWITGAYGVRYGGFKPHENLRDLKQAIANKKQREGSAS